MDLNIGDRIERSTDYAIDPPIEILAVRATGYSWRYVCEMALAPAFARQLQDHVVYDSDKTSDPFFDRGWRLMRPSAVFFARDGLAL